MFTNCITLATTNKKQSTMRQNLFSVVGLIAVAIGLSHHVFGANNNAKTTDTLNFCVKNTSNSYSTISQAISVEEGDTINVITSRYSEWAESAKVEGKGVLNIYSGGERSYMGTLAKKGATYPNWDYFLGNVHIYPYKIVEPNCGFYGILMNSGTFQPENIAGSNYNKLFESKRIVLHKGATIAVESGTRGIRIGELNTEEDSELNGYYKKSTAHSYFLVGANNTDATLAGRIRVTAQGNKISLIKEGNGVYTITGNNNDINGVVRVDAGGLLIDNDVATAQANKMSGATGKNGTVAVNKEAWLGGKGNVSAKQSDVYGALIPGNSSNDLGTLYFTNYEVFESVSSTVVFHPKSKVICRISSAESYSSIYADTIGYSSITQDFENLVEMPRLAIELTTNSTLAVGNEFVLFKSAQKKGTKWDFVIRYPKAYTWEVTQQISDNGAFMIVAKVTSLEYGGQGDIQDNDNDASEVFGGYPDEDWTADKTDSRPLRFYADLLGKKIGVAAATYRYDCSKTSGAAGLINKEFNMIVAENEMKFDATEPSQNNFSYGGSDAIMSLAERSKQEVRGHTLAWHSQVAQWVSSDGKKNNNNFTREELLSILKNHIFNVVGKYKGRIVEWDVCNEVLDDDQSIIRTSPNSYKLRPSIWATYIGEEFIDSAFVWAHQADPTAKLYINDYGVEFKGNIKSEAYFNLVSRLKNSGLPIDGCGLQCHLTTGELDTLKLENNIKRYAELGLNCIITELDIALDNPTSNDAFDIQAKEYGAITRIFLRNQNCPSMLIWGISDNNSWRQNNPLLFDSSLKPKDAYYNVHKQFREAAKDLVSDDCPDNPDNITENEVGGMIISTTYYNIYGQEVIQPKGITIVKLIYDNGTVVVKKQFFK